MRRILHADQRLKQNHKEAGSSPRTVPVEKRTWTDVEPGKYLFSDYEVSKKLMHLLRHGQDVRLHWSDSIWKKSMAGGGGGNKKRYQYCIDSSGTIVYLRGHSGSNLIDPALQDNVLIGPGIFPYIYHVGSTFNLHSIVRNGLVPGGQNSNKRQTVFFLPVDPWTRITRILIRST